MSEALNDSALIAPHAPRGAMRWSDLVRDDRVHRCVYTDPAVFEREQSHIFGGTWVYIAHESELPNEHDFKTGYLGIRPIIITRDGDGQINVLFNRCRHRGATVCREDQGNARSFTCPYHGWTYQNSGRLTGVPWQKGYGPDFDRDEYGLARPAQVASYRGFVFATLNPEAPPLPEHLGRAAPLLDQWIDRNPNARVHARSGAHRMLIRANWKLVYDNGTDGYHPAFSHRSLLQVAKRLGEERDMQYFGKSPDESPMYCQYLGNGHTFVDQRPTYPDKPGAYWEQQRPQPGREALEAQIRDREGERADELLDLAIGSQMNLNIFPNLLIIGNQIQVIEPRAADATQLTWYATTIEDVPDSINAIRMRTQEDFPGFGEPDDLANFEECQRGLAIPEVEWVLMNRGYGIEGRQRTDEDGVVTGPVTDELVMRNYLHQWARLMDAEPELTAS